MQSLCVLTIMKRHENCNTIHLPGDWYGREFYKPLSQSCAGQGLGFSSWAHTICKHDRLDDESEKINNYRERINDKTSKES